MNLSERIRSELEARILSGEWKPGHPIPAEHALMATYGCARMTVNKALAGMAAAGFVTRRRRAGTVVASPVAERAVLEIADFAGEAEKLGLPYAHTILARGVVATEKGAMLAVTTLHERAAGGGGALPRCAAGHLAVAPRRLDRGRACRRRTHRRRGARPPARHRPW